MTRKFILISLLAIIISVLGIVIFSRSNGITQWIVISLVLVSSLCVYLLAEANLSLDNYQIMANKQVTTLEHNLHHKRARIIKDLDEFTNRSSELIADATTEVTIFTSILVFPMITDLLRGTKVYEKYYNALDFQLTRYLDGDGPYIRITCFPEEIHKKFRSVISNAQDKELLSQYQRATENLLIKLKKCQEKSKEYQLKDFEFHTPKQQPFSNIRLTIVDRKRAIIGVSADYQYANRETHKNFQIKGFEVESFDTVAELESQWETYPWNDVTINNEFIESYIGRPPSNV